MLPIIRRFFTRGPNEPARGASVDRMIGRVHLACLAVVRREWLAIVGSTSNFANDVEAMLDN
ncbi:MAG: hypothetical protein B7Z74_00555 [Deltaproteobacteria bacterium 21-66-5]|nr:MAG: hypothetical protein B7Z74_00555 [Deltaproteobacteria bacterium 21-66-5]